MFGIIWMIVLGYVIFKVVRRKEEESGRRRPDAGMPPNGTPLGRIPVHTNQNINRQTQQAQPNQAKVPGQTNQGKQPNQDGQAQQGGSTLAYLEEKARQDAIEHEREKQEEARRLHQNYGGFRPAGRLYEGDSVPNGSRCVVCGYCGAENLVPMMPKEHYSCYFCRERLT